MCNLASIAVNQFVDAQKKIFDFNRLKEVTKVVTKNLNKIINVNYYPVPEARKSNMRHRPIGIGVSTSYILSNFLNLEFLLLCIKDLSFLPFLYLSIGQNVAL